ncbi:MAG: sulfite exporter TauE/SafE family protein [Candidatus Omnitrophica bacterium]|nr:sulfite exporter TauE/SafE family protein [Candidatus Omnitrophota bacterium]MCM8810766.1 sulfite exporter TauE/SafE family protein [Candidatus Omnitrophota bacterium]
MGNIYQLNFLNFFLLEIYAFLIGVSKTGIPGVGILAIPLTAMILPAKASTGIILPLLIIGDIFAVTYYKRKAIWKYIFRLLPFACLGVVIGYLFMEKVNDVQLSKLIGIIIVIILFLNWYWNKKEIKIPQSIYFAPLIGLFAGITTMMANAAGPFLIIYLLAMKLPKTEFVGTGAWYFFILNWFKVPFSAKLGLINIYSLKLNLLLLPGVALGSLLGIIFLKKIPQKIFNNLVQILALISALKLIF